MGFTEDEFYRTPMEKDNEEWMKNYLAGKYDFMLDALREGREFSQLDADMQDAIRRGANYGFEIAVQQVFQHAKSVLLQKHADYGPKNISQSPGGALNGLRVRMWDKLARINNLLENGAEPENESLRDSFLDMANYALIAMLVLDGDWPDE